MMRPDILQYSGHYFDFTTGRNYIDIFTIAKALSKICRFGGHTKYFYSVAQHSVAVSLIVPPEDAMWGLLHDAHEAFVGDIPSPLKQLLPDFVALEKRIESEVLAYFGLTGKKPASVKNADLVMLATEQRDLMPPHDDQWADIALIKPLKYRIGPLEHEQAFDLFIRRFHEITFGSPLGVQS